MRMNLLTALLFSLAFSCIVGCNATPRTESDRRVLSAEVQALVVALKEKDASISKYFDSAAGYARESLNICERTEVELLPADGQFSH